MISLENRFSMLVYASRRRIMPPDNRLSVFTVCVCRGDAHGVFAPRFVAQEFIAPQCIAKQFLRGSFTRSFVPLKFANGPQAISRCLRRPARRHRSGLH